MQASMSNNVRPIDHIFLFKDKLNLSTVWKYDHWGRRTVDGKKYISTKIGYINNFSIVN